MGLILFRNLGTVYPYNLHWFLSTYNVCKILKYNGLNKTKSNKNTRVMRFKLFDML